MSYGRYKKYDYLDYEEEVVEESNIYITEDNTD